LSANYRWNQSELAAAYDRDADQVHPCYREVQDAILEETASVLDSGECVVDLGGGSGRLIERMLERFPQVTAVLVDQSESFLEIAAQRLHRFGERFRCVVSRLQEDWQQQIPEPVRAVVSMSAIHHLDPAEKQRCYRQAFRALAPGGVFANGDEVRPESDEDYLAMCRRWGEHMRAGIADSRISPPMAVACEKWRERNIEQWDQPRVSGDDCHETTALQLAYLRTAGFETARAGWSHELWTVLVARR